MTETILLIIFLFAFWIKFRIPKVLKMCDESAETETSHWFNLLASILNQIQDSHDFENSGMEAQG